MFNLAQRYNAPIYGIYPFIRFDCVCVLASHKTRGEKDWANGESGKAKKILLHKYEGLAMENKKRPEEILMRKI